MGSPSVHPPSPGEGPLLTTVRVSDHGDHRELPQPPLLPQEKPLPAEFVQGLPNLRFLIFQETLVHLQERLS